MSDTILLFDFGGVLVDLDKARCIRAFDEIGFDVRPLLGTYVQAGILSALERGEADVPAFCDGLRRLAGRPALTDAAIVHAWEQYLTGVPADRLELLLRIRRHYPVSVLSNTNPVHWRLAEEGYFRYRGHAPADFFDKAFLSYELGVEKPDPRIFQAVVEGLQCRPEQLLFFDDSPVNCEAARRCGLRARLAPAGGRWMDYFDAEGRLHDAED